MNKRRLKLQGLLEQITPNVYYQPPETIKMKYPCIVYNIQNGDTQFADNQPYIFVKRYQITIIDSNPDSPIVDEVAKLKRCLFERTFRSNNLNHFIFNIYY